MATLRDIRRRIQGVQNTSKITQAMKMVAAAKLRRAQEAIIAARPFAHEIKALRRHLMAQVDRSLLPILDERPDRQSALIILVTADRGLCGAFNANLVRFTASLVENEYRQFREQGKIRLLCIGKKGIDFFSKQDIEIVEKHVGIVNTPDYTVSNQIMGGVIQGFLAGEYDRVQLIYNEFKSVIRQRIVAEDILPVPSEPAEIHLTDGHEYHPYTQYIYEPSERALMESLVPRSLDFQLYTAMLESNAAEQGARMTAMDTATTNARDMIAELTLRYNRERQAAITKELLEIVSGAEALKNAL